MVGHHLGSTSIHSSSHHESAKSMNNGPSSRILTDVPCKVCHDNSSGKHYGIFACDGCAGFFKRSIRRNRQYVCKNKGHGGCQVDKTHRNQCRACRLRKCVEAGMNRDAVQHERGPRNSTIRRQMALLMKESSEILSSVYRASPALFQRFMPQMPPQLGAHHHQMPHLPPLSHPLIIPPLPMPTTSSSSSSSSSSSTLNAHSPLISSSAQQESNQQISPSLSSTSNHQNHNSNSSSSSSHNQLSSVTPPALSPNQTNELSIDQNCTPPSSSSSSSSNSTANCMSPLEFGSFSSHHNNLNLNTSSTPVMSPLMAPTIKNPYDVKSFLTSPEATCETAARLLFLCVRWAKSIPAFVNLDMSDQIAMLEEGWREIFILSAAQFQMPLEIGPLMAYAGLGASVDGSSGSSSTSNGATGSEKFLNIMNELHTLQDIIVKFKQAQIDPTEFTCLKAISLFKTNLPNKNDNIENNYPSSSSSSSSSSSLDSPTGARSSSSSSTSCHLKDLPSIIAFQEQTQLTLSKYDAHAYPTQPFRFGKLLLLLPALRSVSPQTIEEVFFKKTIGNISIERVIVDMYKSQM